MTESFDRGRASGVPLAAARSTEIGSLNQLRKRAAHGHGGSRDSGRALLWIVLVLAVIIGGYAADVALATSRTGDPSAYLPSWLPGNNWLRNTFGTEVSSLQGDYLYANSTRADFLQLTQSGGSLTGSLTDTEVSPTDDTITQEASDLPVTGSVNGSGVSLTIPSLNQTWTGNHNGNGSLSLSIPSPDGSSMQSVEFKPAVGDDYTSSESAVKYTALLNATATLSGWMTISTMGNACTVSETPGFFGTEYTAVTLVGSDASSICQNAVAKGGWRATSLLGPQLVCHTKLDNALAGVTGDEGTGQGVCTQLINRTWP